MARVLDGDVEVVHVSAPPVNRSELDALTNQLDRELRRLRPRPGAVVVVGDPSAGVLRAARQTNADCVVIGAHGPGSPARGVVGSTATRVARDADRSVLLVRRPVRARYRRVLVGVDGSQPSLDAVRMAITWFPGATVDVVTVTAVPGHRKLTPHAIDPRVLDDLASGVEAAAHGDIAECLAANQIADGVRHVDAVVGRPAEQLVRQVRERHADLVVVGATGAGALRRALVGSVARDVARDADCDVLLVRRPAHVARP